MALTRGLLNGFGLESNQVSAIIDAHSETVEGLKAEIEKMKAAKEKAEKDLADLSSKGDSWKDKYEKEHSDFEAYKADQANKASQNAIKDAYRGLLKETGVSEKRIDAVMKVTDFSGITLDDGGKLVSADKLAETIKADWSDFITSTEAQGAKTETPPANNGGKKTMTKEEILAIKDAAERQKAIAENPSVFGI